MKKLNSVKIVEDFWAAVWRGHNPDAIDRFVVDDCVITTGGVDIVTKDRFKAWVKQFLDKVADLEFGVVETFQNEDGSRVRRAGGSRAKTMGYWAGPQISGRSTSPALRSGLCAKTGNCCTTGLSAVRGSCSSD
jgi:hypothetical protein